MEISIFGLSYIGCISTACFVTDEHNVLRVDSNYTEVDLINQGNSPVVVTKKSPEYANALQRLRLNQIMIDLVRHWADEDGLEGERYYAIVG